MTPSFVRRPYRHFWRAQFEKVFVLGIVAGLLVFSVLYPDHSWSDEMKLWCGQAFVILLWMLRGTWKDPATGDGPQSPNDSETAS